MRYRANNPLQNVVAETLFHLLCDSLLMEIRKDVVSLSDISLDSSGMHAQPAIGRSISVYLLIGTESQNTI